ncbi:unnamed protein product [Rhodiola kirilowii]
MLMKILMSVCDFYGCGSLGETHHQFSSALSSWTVRSGSSSSDDAFDFLYLC